MKPFEFIPVAGLNDQQIRLYSEVLPEIVEAPQTQERLKLRDMGAVVQDFHSVTSTQRTLSNLRDAMQAADGQPVHQDFYVVQRENYAIGMASRTTQPLRREGAHRIAFNQQQMSWLGSHVTAWLDPRRKTVESETSLAAVYQYLINGSELDGQRVPAWTIEPQAALVQGMSKGLFLANAFTKAGLRRNTAAPARYASSFSTKHVLKPQPKHVLYTSNSIMPFEPSTIRRDQVEDIPSFS